MTVNGFDVPNCDTLNDRLDEFIYMSTSRLAETGYYLFVNRSIDCAGGSAYFGVLVASDDVIVYKNVKPDEVLTIPHYVSDLNMCQNAEDGGLCAGLDIAFGSGYACACCLEHGLCCPC